MLYLKKSFESQSIFFPRTGLEDGYSQMELSLKSTIGNKQVFDAEVYDHNPYADYWNVIASLPDGMMDGEYEYRLIQEGKIVGKGLCYVGEFKTIGTGNAGEIKVKQYGE